jgi:hypothetical protein
MPPPDRANSHRIGWKVCGEAHTAIPAQRTGFIERGHHRACRCGVGLHRVTFSDDVTARSRDAAGFDVLRGPDVSQDVWVHTIHRSSLSSFAPMIRLREPRRKRRPPGSRGGDPLPAPLPGRGGRVLASRISTQRYPPSPPRDGDVESSPSSPRSRCTEQVQTVGLRFTAEDATREVVT